MEEATAVRGDWFQSVGGRRIYPLDPHPSDVFLEEIAHALACICRFGGHVPRGPYSVAEHSVYVARVVAKYDPKLGLLALMHDAPEYVLGDVIRPLKRSRVVTSEYADLERRWGVAIGEACGFTWLDPLPEIVKLADDAVLMAERRDLLAAPAGPWRERESSVKCTERIYSAVGSHAAEKMFLEAYLFHSKVCR